eukprot:1036615-Lingulodinium_polyedra.AAC.1
MRRSCPGDSGSSSRVASLWPRQRALALTRFIRQIIKGSMFGPHCASNNVEALQLLRRAWRSECI